MFQSRSLSSFVNKAISNSLKINNNKFFTTIPKSQSTYILNTNNNINKNNETINFKSILNNSNNIIYNINNNSSFNSYRSYSTNNSNNNKNNQNNSEGHLIFENPKPFVHKIFFIVCGAQLCLCLLVLSYYYTESQERNPLIAIGAVACTILTYVFFYQFARKDIAAIHTFNKGRVIQITSYHFNGFPTRRRTVTLDSIISAKSNETIKQPVTAGQDKNISFKVAGDTVFFNTSLKKAKVLDPFQLDRIIHASKQSTIQKKKK